MRPPDALPGVLHASTPGARAVRRTGSRGDCATPSGGLAPDGNKVASLRLRRGRHYRASPVVWVAFVAWLFLVAWALAVVRAAGGSDEEAPAPGTEPPGPSLTGARRRRLLMIAQSVMLAAALAAAALSSSADQ